jgi:hypothetical protein
MVNHLITLQIAHTQPSLLPISTIKPVIPWRVSHSLVIIKQKSPLFKESNPWYLNYRRGKERNQGNGPVARLYFCRFPNVVSSINSANEQGQNNNIKRSSILRLIKISPGDWAVLLADILKDTRNLRGFTVRDWTSRDHKQYWESLTGLKEANRFLQRPSVRRTKELLKLNRNQLR